MYCIMSLRDFVIPLLNSLFVGLLTINMEVFYISYDFFPLPHSGDLFFFHYFVGSGYNGILSVEMRCWTLV